MTKKGINLGLSKTKCRHFLLHQPPSFHNNAQGEKQMLGLGKVMHKEMAGGTLGGKWHKIPKDGEGEKIPLVIHSS